MSHYINNRLCAPQWRSFLSIFAEELAQDMTSRHLGQVMRRTGEQFARQHSLPGTSTIADLQMAINRVWDAMDWGWVEIHEAQDRLVLSHYYAPLQAAFGAAHQAWSSAFLEGAYDLWMHQSGADSQLRVTSADDHSASGAMVFHFGR
ncbi:cellulose biosynthesis protein BcsD [Bordetella sp. FB-8]|uniref:cellulose biosynthesis protein BcsD n=1 Tax=Bordetella sp. FB-8 TaxID=1159870 RepID=UPI00039B7B30|nr:cellulose biosynthesis protein BcsD [Bordetella sp. FB-8]